MITCGYKPRVTQEPCGDPAVQFFRIEIIDIIQYRFRCMKHLNLGVFNQYHTTEISENEAIVAQVMGM